MAQKRSIQDIYPYFNPFKDPIRGGSPIQLLTNYSNFDFDSSPDFYSFNGNPLDPSLDWLLLDENRTVPGLKNEWRTQRDTLWEQLIAGKIQINVSKSKYELDIEGRIFPIALSDENTPIGEYFVREKWEYPYWKSQTRLWLPKDSNPIGRYLVILEDPETNKINFGIHQWIQWEFSDSNFFQGNYSSGCLRARPEDMEEIYNLIPLGSKIIIE